MTALRLDELVRVSRVGGREGDSFISPDLQREEIERYANGRESMEIVRHDPELDVSGAATTRPVLDEIMRKVRAGQSDGIIVAKLDRFARSLTSALSLIEELEKHNAVLVSVQDNIDLSTPMGKAFVRIILVFAELERDRVIDSWVSAQSHAIANGVYMASAVKKGYDKDPDSRKLIPNSEAPIIRRIFQMKGNGETMNAIRAMLETELPLPDGGKWVNPMINAIIKNRVYRGELIRGQHRNSEAHEPLVTEAEWQAANSRAKPLSAPRQRHDYLLTGLIRCAACRHTMTPNETHTNKGKSRTLVYNCRKHHRAGECPEPSGITRKKVEAYVESAWREQMSSLVLVGKPDDGVLKRASAAVAEAETELREFAGDLTARKALGPDMYSEAMETRSDALRTAQRDLDELMSSVNDGQGNTDSYDVAGTVERRAMLAASIDAIFIRRGGTAEERCLILWRGEGPDNLPRQGASVGTMPERVTW